MRLNMTTPSVDEMLAELQRDIEEIKTAQRTSQNSGMLARINRAGIYDSFGDVVTWSTSSNQTPQQLSRIPLVATPNASWFYTVTAEQTFVPKHNKPAIAIPLLELEVKTNGYTGTSEFYMNAQSYGLRLEVRNSANVVVATAQSQQSFNELFRPVYSASSKHKWTTSIGYSSTVALELAYKFTVRSSDAGVTSSTLRGTW